VSDFALRFGLALIVVIVAGAAIVISRRNYAKSSVFERNVAAFRAEFQRSIDAAQAATIKSVAKTIRDSITSVIKPIDSAIRDFDARLERLEQQQADVAAGQVAGTQLLDVRLARLEEHADGGAIRNLEARLAGLEKHGDGGAIRTLEARLADLEKDTQASTSQIAGAQKQSLEENERIAARVIGLEQKLMALNDQQEGLPALRDQLSAIKQTIEGAALREQENLAVLSDQQQNLTALGDRLSSIKQTSDEASGREQDIKNSIDAVSARVLTVQARIDEIFPRLLLEGKAREDQGRLISLSVKRVKKLNADLTELARRLDDLESRLHSKAGQPDAHRHLILESTDLPASTIGDQLKDAAAKAADGAVPLEAKTNGETDGIFGPPAQDKESGKEPANDVRAESEARVEASHADQHAT
jgi:chromosome segregation ATPase